MNVIDLSLYTYKGDPIAWFLLKKLKVKPAVMGLLAVGISALVHLVIGNIIGVSLFPFRYTALPAWHEAIQEFILAPLVWYYYAWMPAAISNSLNSLWINRVFDPKEEYEGFVDEFKSRFKIIKFAPIIAIPILVQIFTVEVAYWNTWKIASLPNSSLYFILYGFYMSLAWYFVILMSFRELLVVIQFLKLFQSRKIQINLWHPDKKGGLGSLSGYRLNIAILLAIMALIIIIISLPGPYKAPNPSISVPALIILYFFLGPLFFFVPLIGSHRAMKEAKFSLLKELTDDMSKYVSHFKDQASSSQKKLKIVKWELFEPRLKIYQLVADYPEWPIDLRLFGRFLFVTLLPIAINILTLVLKR